MRKDLSNLYHIDSKNESKIISSGNKPLSKFKDDDSEDSSEDMFGKGVDKEEMLHAIHDMMEIGESYHPEKRYQGPGKSKFANPQQQNSELYQLQ